MKMNNRKQLDTDDASSDAFSTAGKSGNPSSLGTHNAKQTKDQNSLSLAAVGSLIKVRVKDHVPKNREQKELLELQA